MFVHWIHLIGSKAILESTSSYSPTDELDSYGYIGTAMLGTNCLDEKAFEDKASAFGKLP